MKKYGREIAIDGSDSVLGLEGHLDRMVAKLMEIEIEVVTIARQWREVIKRAAITEGIDSVNLLLEAGNEIIVQPESKTEMVEIEMNIEAEEYEILK